VPDDEAGPHDDTRPPGQAVLTVEETARLLRIGRTLAFAAVRDGSIPSIRIGRRILVPRDALEALLQQGRPRR
jgi:excisionase family DNA binding protein